MDVSSPVIVVGAGRSGTTLLDAVLDEHPDLYMIGETSFLLQRLWTTFFDKPAYVNNQRYIRLCQQTNPAWRDLPMAQFARTHIYGDFRRLGPVFDRIEAEENIRIARELGRTFAELLVPPSLRAGRWGFREIWMGSDAFPYSWDLFLTAFPKAQYLQCLRHPLEYLRSNFDNNGVQATHEAAVRELGQWLKMVEHSRSLASTGRYFEFRYEDFIADNGTLKQILDFIGLPYDDRCMKAMDFRYVPSKRSNSFEGQAAELVAAVPGLREAMEALNYRI